MKKNLEAVILIGLIVVVISATVWNSLRIKFRENNTHTASYSAAHLISTAKPKYMNFIKKVKWFGKAEAKERISLISPMEGEVIFASQKNGGMVKKGDILFKLGGSLVNNKIKSLNSRIKNLKKQIEIERKIVKLQRLSFQKRLIKKSEMLSALEKLLSLESAIDSDIHQLDVLKASLIIKSPINGLFKETAYQGQFINKGESLGSVLSATHLRIVGYVFVNNPSRLLNKELISNNKPLGKITKVLPIKTQSGAVIFWAEKLYERLSVGEVLEGNIEVGKKVRRIAVPEESVVYNESGAPFVVIKTKKGYKKIKVKTGKVSKGWVEIVSGVKPDNEVVVKGSYELLYKNFSKTFKASD